MLPGEGRPHALVVGGTGMLRGLTLALAEEGYAVSVVARTAGRLTELAEAARGTSGLIHPLAVDYRDSAGLQETLRQAVRHFGPMELAVCWIHSVAPHALEQMASVIGQSPAPCRLFHVRGSAAANPAAPEATRPPAWLSRYPNIRYRQVILGFIVEGSTSRWLTHQEISGGVLAAVQVDREFSIVGTVEPWSMRP